MKTSIHFCFASGIALCCLAMTASTQAQIIRDTTLPIVPDETLPTNSEVELQNNNTRVITGGTEAGSSNLFHSFEQFSVPTGSAAYFNNASKIQNIITRVTGASISNIDGLLRTNGMANLFLLNPNGIIFGPNARLDVTGSFVASTADKVVFDNGFAFSATNPQASPLLTISVPLGLQFGANPGRIVNQSVEGLNVRPGKTLAIVGGDVSLDGGILQARGGQVELGGVTGAGTVGLNVDGNTLRLSFPDSVTRADVSLANGAEVDVAAGGGGSIAINAQNLNILGGSRLRAGISPLSGVHGAQAGDITLNARGTLKIENSSIYNAVFGVGNGGDLRINTGQLIIRDGIVATATFSQGGAGDLIVKATGLVELTGSPSSNGRVPTNFPGNTGDRFPNVSLPIGLFSASINIQDILTTQNIPVSLLTGGGNAGNLSIESGQLIVRDGAVVAAGTSTTGNAGNLTVNAKDFIELSGTSANEVPLNIKFLNIVNRVPSGLRNGTTGSGQGGNLTVTTGRLIVRDGAWVATNTGGQMPAGELTVKATESVELSGTSSANGVPSFLTSATRGAGEAKPLTINTRRLIVRDGAILSAATAGSGKGGDLTIDATESVELIGTSRQGISAPVLQQLLRASEDFVVSLVEVGSFPSGVVTGSLKGQGDAGTLTINTGQLVVRDGAQVNLNSEGGGKAGNIEITARSIRLDNRGKLTAEARAGAGGDIRLRNSGLLLMRRNSEISTSAGTAQAGGDGGNISIDTDFIVAVPSEDSDITADAFTGKGGNIQIRAQGIFGIQFRKEGTPESDITTRSAFGVDGVVEINTPDVDPSRGLATLPAELVDVSGLIVQGCPGGGDTVGQSVSEFTITGRGGLPPKPTEPLRSDAVRVELDRPIQSQENRASAAVTVNPTSSKPKPLVEAQGWVFNDKGEVVLVAQAPTVTPYSSPSTPATCHAF
jgi:filamentous hemagglutinin family protein